MRPGGREPHLQRGFETAMAWDTAGWVMFS